MDCRKSLLKYLNRAGLCLAAALVMPGMVSAEETAKRCQYRLAQTLPIHFDGTRPTIEAGINGKPVKLLVDSGAFSTSLFMHAAERLQLTLRHSPIKTIGIGGESGTYLTKVKEIRFGESRGNYVDILVDRQYSPFLGSDGLVGAEFLFQRSDMEMSLVDRYLKFYKATGCESTILSYWDHDAFMIPFKLGTEDDPRPEVEVVVNGKQLRALIDTGASYSLIDLAAAAAVGVTPSSPNVVKYNGTIGGIGEHRTDAWIAPFESIAVGDETIKNPKILILDKWGGVRKDVKSFGLNRWINEQPQMILGIDFLRAHRILFSLDQKIMYFTYLGGNVFRTSSRDDFSFFETAAAKGDAEAQAALAGYYLRSPDLKRDPVKAAELLGKAVEKGNVAARVELGQLYEDGDGVEKDLSKAVSLYRKAAEENDESGQIRLARMYERGLGTEKDLSLAFQWYKKAAEQGSPYAQAKTGVAYMQGRGVGKDQALAVEWLDKASADDKWSGYYRNLGIVMFRAGLFDRSESAFQKAITDSPGDEYSALWLYIARARSGKSDGMVKKLEESKAKWKPEHKWPAAIADFYTGRITNDQLMKLAHHEDKKTDNEQMCEANFYSAEWHLIENRPKEARPLLESVVRSCPKDFIEYDAAVSELERIDAK